VTRSNANCALVLELLYQLIGLFRDYFGGVFDEDKVRENFTLVYELLDETVDYGYPQNISADTLKLYIMNGTSSGRAWGAGKANSGGSDVGNVTIQATGKIPWRREGIKYRKNEVFLDVIESVNVLVSAKGTVLRQDVSGVVVMKCFLSGMPECRFGMNDKIAITAAGGGDGSSSASSSAAAAAGAARKPGGPPSMIELDDITFHQCVRLHSFDSDRSISFIPPDGDTELMKYRITENIQRPFVVMPTLSELGRTRLEFKVQLKSSFDANMFATNVVCKLPCPTNTGSTQITCTAGKAKFEPEESVIAWKIKRFPGETVYNLSAEIFLTNTTTEKQWSRPPITMDFAVPMFAASGLQVRYLKVVEKSIPQAIKWVRYLTKAGTYEVRI
jgi:AP-2 complex subunit mu-1